MDSTRNTLEGAFDGDKVTSMIDREVYTQDGLYVGQVHDLKLDFDHQTVSHVVVQDLNREAFSLPAAKDGILVPYRFVRSVGDIVLINNVTSAREKESDHQGVTADD